MWRLTVINEGVIDYATAWEKQQARFNSLLHAKDCPQKETHKSKSTSTTPEESHSEIHGMQDASRTHETHPEATIAPEMTLMLCEHPHVYTLGKSGLATNLLVDAAFLKKIGATYYKIDRGGDITYHGYGQLVGYPILDLEQLGLGLKEYIHLLEEAIIRTIGDYGIRGDRLPGATGVWLESETPRARKIAAIGVRASRFITMHGFALNVNTDLRYFSYINPCGFVDKGVTSMAQEIGEAVDFEAIKTAFTSHFCEILKILK